jgi:ankyrin repeat protein
VVAAPLDDLFQAVATSDAAGVRDLLDRGMDASSTNKEGLSLVMVAAREGDIEIVRLLLDRKARVNQRTPSNETAIMFAARSRGTSPQHATSSRARPNSTPRPPTGQRRSCWRRATGTWRS